MKENGRKAKTKDHIFRKVLIEKFQLKESHIGPIVARSKVFATIKTRQGEPLPFTFHLATITFIGCELFTLGLSFRNVDPILYQIHSSIDFQKWAETIRSEDIVILISKEGIRPDVMGEYGRVTDKTTKVTLPFSLDLVGHPTKVRAAKLHISFIPRERMQKIRYASRPIDSMEAYIIVDLPAILGLVDTAMT